MNRLLVLLVLFLPQSFYAQTIEAINNNEQALALLKKVCPRFEEKLLDADFKHRRDSMWPFLKQFNYYEKADFDNNGYTDLLFNGCAGCNYRNNDYTVSPPLVILSYGNDSFRIKDLSCRKYDVYALAGILQTASQPRIKIASYGYEAEYNKRAHRIKKNDTLVYAFDEFIESTRPAHYNIERISFTALNNNAILLDSLSFELTISRDSTWLTREISGGGIMALKKYVRHTDSATWNRLTGLLNCMNFPGLKKYYSSGQYHEVLGFLSVHYDKNKVGLIEDDGLIGTYGLRVIYDLLKATAHASAGRLVSEEGGMLAPPDIFR